MWPFFIGLPALSYSAYINKPILEMSLISEYTQFVPLSIIFSNT